MVQRSEITGRVIGCAIAVHRVLGPGLLESAYQACLSYEFHRAGLAVATQVPLPITYGDVQIECGYRLDFIVNKALIVEVKAQERILPIHKAQVLTYMRLTGIAQGLLINFCVPALHLGVSSLVLPARYPGGELDVPGHSTRARDEITEA